MQEEKQELKNEFNDAFFKNVDWKDVERRYQNI